ncbi:MAG: DoxX family protein [Burkholderiaceae bacterium]
MTASNDAPANASGMERALRATVSRLGRMAMIIAPPVLRIALAVPFFRSGLTRWDGFGSLSASTVYLFEHMFKLHLVGEAYSLPAPLLVAYVTATAEIVLPILLVLGLGTRFVALALLIMTGVIQLVSPEGWANFHLPWASMALAIIAIGPGWLSIDHLLDRWRRAD